MGWARRVGHQVVASQEYFDRCAMDNYLSTDCTPDMFPEYRPPPGNFVAGMKLEAVDPLNLATICVATVMKVKPNCDYLQLLNLYKISPLIKLGFVIRAAMSPSLA